MERNKIYCGDWKEIARTLPPNSIDCIITSPPYYGLRDYGHPGQLGQEKTPEEFINSLVEGFRILRAALKDSGTLWVNIGDSYWGGKGQNGNTKARTTAKERGYKQSEGTPIGSFRPLDGKHESIKPKDLIGIPWMLAFALRADGWYLRQDIIWSKPNPMPESVTDRCTKSHEYIFLLSKSSRYYFDAEAIKEKAVWADSGRKSKKRGEFNGKTNALENRETFRAITPTRNRRSVWEVTTKPFKGAHFAAFPHELIDPAISAGTSEQGNCPNCGQPWIRQTEKIDSAPCKNGHQNKAKAIIMEQRGAKSLETSMHQTNEIAQFKTVGWAPSCQCGITQTVPAIVYDPFMGSGTTASAAKSLGRDFLGSELNPEYMNINDNRLSQELGLFKP